MKYKPAYLWSTTYYPQKPNPWPIQPQWSPDFKPSMRSSVGRNRTTPSRLPSTLGSASTITSAWDAGDGECYGCPAKERLGGKKKCKTPNLWQHDSRNQLSITLQTSHSRILRYMGVKNGLVVVQIPNKWVSIRFQKQYKGVLICSYFEGWDLLPGRGHHIILHIGFLYLFVVI